MSAASGRARTSVACARRRAAASFAATAPWPAADRSAEAADNGGWGTRDAEPRAAEPHDNERELRDQVEELRTEVGQLRQALDSRPVIDQARGMVMALAPCDARTAWWVLVQVSQHSNVKLRRVAAALVDGAEGEPVPRPVRQALAAAMRQVRTDASG